jgi:hypothetical protein
MKLAVRAAGLALVVLVAIGSAAIVQGFRSDDSGADRKRDSGMSEAPQGMPVPDVVGRTEGRAVKALGAAGLVANVRFVKAAPRTGKVLTSDPAVGTELRPKSVVVLTIALSPRRPAPAASREQELQPFNSLVEDHPDAFVGLYRDEEGIPVAVFGPGADPAAWRESLTTAAEGRPYRTETCSRSRAELRSLQDEIAKMSWTKDKDLPFGVYVHPATCTTRVESDLLTDADIRALADSYGTAISIDTTEGSHPVLLDEPS